MIIFIHSSKPLHTSVVQRYPYRNIKVYQRFIFVNESYIFTPPMLKLDLTVVILLDTIPNLTHPVNWLSHQQKDALEAS